MKTKNVVGAIALMFAGILVGAILVSGFGWVHPGLADVKLGADKSPVEVVNTEASTFSQAFIEVANKVTPSIVQISVVAEREKDNQFFFFHDFEQPDLQGGSGSGIIMSNDGYILTNNHVVENAKKVTVTLFDRRNVEAKVIGTDPLTDLAVIKINADDLTPAYLGDSEELQVGQWVMAIGNPMGLSSTVTSGIVSAIDRGSLGLNRDPYAVENFIQTDAAINPGNSGGALVDLSGAVVGVNTAIASRTGTYIGYGFAIPINLAKSVAKDLIAHGKISRGYIGVQIRNIDADMAMALGMDKPNGVLIEKVNPGTAASESDIKEYDVVLSVDGVEMSKTNQLQSYISSKMAGTTVTLEILRDGEVITRDVTLKGRDGETTQTVVDRNESEREEERVEASELSFEKIGFTAKNLSERERTQYGIETDKGVMITDVEMYSIAGNQGLAPRLLIVEVNQEPVYTVNELEEMLMDHKGSAVMLKVSDGKDAERFVGLRIPE